MNERIRELLEDADMDYLFFRDEMRPGIVHPDSLKTFAKLIVRECIVTIQMGITRDGHNTEKYLRSMKHLKDIKEHFGVEE